LNVAERTTVSVRQERATLVGVFLPGREPTGAVYDPLSELAALTQAAGGTVVDRVFQRRQRVCPGTYIGKGKLLQLAERVVQKQADVVIFDNDLSPSQIRDIERVTRCKVIDRTELILDIFASRARTHAARLQVELAQLEYTAPRLRGMWSHLERIAGAGGATAAGIVGGIGTRGPGERQIEIDRRIVQKRMTLLRAQLRDLEKRKQREVRARVDYYTVSLVGYTNAGKSTLLNALTGADALVEDKLFATLDTRTRRWNLGGGQTALLSDTVGFVRDLPHHLVASFRATLEETIHADLLLHVVDAAAPDAERQIRAVEKVLADLNVADTPTLVVLNKIDAVLDAATLSVLRAANAETIEISARTRIGLDRLTETVSARMRSRYVRIVAQTGADNGKLLAYINRHGQVLKQDYHDGIVDLEIRLPAGEIPRIRGLGARLLEQSATAE
jgi:GTP-binding protein HflX